MEEYTIVANTATSVPSERVFSTAGDILTDQRASLSPKHLDTLLFLKKISNNFSYVFGLILSSFSEVLTSVLNTASLLFLVALFCCVHDSYFLTLFI